MADLARGNLAIFVKAPVMGRAKTRLAQGLGAVHAMRVYRALVGETVRRLARDPRWRTVLAVTPDSFARNSAFAQLMPANIPRIPQGAGDLGRRMARVFKSLTPGPAVIVGCDIPDLCAEDVALAFRALRRADVVLGPAHDGGYWLIGFARAKNAHALASPIRWSSRHALSDTREALHGSRAALLRTLTDIDTVEDYECWRSTQGAV
jgi:rSAM/selenodomain-associated transferase 1